MITLQDVHNKIYKEITEGILDIEDNNFNVFETPICEIYAMSYNSGFGHTFCNDRFWPMPVISEEFNRLTKAVPHKEFRCTFINAKTGKPSSYGTNNPLRYLLNWIASEPISIINDNKATQAALDSWIPKSKRIKAEWTYPDTLTFYYKGNTKEMGIINVVISKK